MTLKQKEFIKMVFNAGYDAGRLEEQNKQLEALNGSRCKAFYRYLEDEVEFFDRAFIELEEKGK